MEAIVAKEKYMETNTLSNQFEGTIAYRDLKVCDLQSQLRKR